MLGCAVPCRAALCCVLLCCPVLNQVIIPTMSFVYFHLKHRPQFVYWGIYSDSTSKTFFVPALDYQTALSAGSGDEAGPRPEVVQATEAADQIGETGRLFLRNLSYAASEEELSQLLGSFGELKEVHLVVDRCARQDSGCASVASMRIYASVKHMPGSCQVAAG